jgi:hypothetical protein
MSLKRLSIVAMAAFLSTVSTGANAFTLEASMARVSGVSDGNRYAPEAETIAAPVASSFASYECKPSKVGGDVVCIYHDPANGNMVCTSIGVCDTFANLNDAARAYVALRN